MECYDFSRRDFTLHTCGIGCQSRATTSRDGWHRRFVIEAETRRSPVGGKAVAGLRYHLAVLVIPAESRSLRNCGLLLWSATWAANHSDRIIRRFERDIFPWIGKRPIAEVSAPELLAVVRRIENRGALETGAHWKPCTGRWAIAGKCSTTPWRPGGQCAIHAATCAARCPGKG